MALEPLGSPREQERGVAGGLLIGSMWGYGACVFYRSEPRKQAGVYRPRHVGERPSLPRAQALGPRYSREHPFPVLLEQRPPRYELVDEFDHVAGEYEA